MKTFRTSGTGNQQTIDPIESDKMPIYETMQDAEADLANLEEGQIGATADSGSELSAPTDTVQSGNMHAVTSNAVAEKLSDIQIGQFTDISNYFANGAYLSYIQKNNSLVILKFNGSSGDTEVPPAGWTTIAKVPYKPISDVINYIITDVHNIFAIRITTNGELQVYNYQNISIIIDASEMICYFTND
jgi:hypothetical protein